jgi:hypothetical protein
MGDKTQPPAGLEVVLKKKIPPSTGNGTLIV